LLAGIVVAIEPYRLDRVYTWLNPMRDSQGSGYQIIHSLMGLGAGGLAGLGIGEGREKFYIPAPQTDMIGTTFGEEVGFIGMMILIALFIVIIYRGLCIAHRAKCPYMSLLVMGLTSMIGIQALMNIAVISGSMPLTGVPLPFISFGGSYLIAMLFGAGMMLSVSRHTDETVIEPKADKYESRDYGRRDRGTHLSCTEYRPTAKRVRSRAAFRR
jgi:cell division protein FtsW